MNDIALSIALLSLVVALYSWWIANKRSDSVRLVAKVLSELQRIDSWQPYAFAILGCTKPLAWIPDASRETWKLSYELEVPKSPSQSSLKEHLLILTGQLEDAAAACEPFGVPGSRTSIQITSDQAVAVLTLLSVARRRMMGAVILMGRREYLPVAASLLGDSVELLRCARHVTGASHTFDGLLDVMKIGLQRAIANLEIEDNSKLLPPLEILSESASSFRESIAVLRSPQLAFDSAAG